MVCEWNTYHHLKARIWIKCEHCRAWHQYRVFPNSISTISMSALYKHRGQPHTHTLNTNHGNPSVAQSFWC